MCGIVSIFAYNHSGGVDRDELRRIRDHMANRGPDGFGEWYSSSDRVGLGHRRLAIIDLSETGAQPMQNEDGSLVITYNGEIYNYQLLRSRLEAKGYRFHSTSDTEVLLHLYAEKGHEMLSDLRGMFAFALWDKKRKGLFLARDPFGIKPLYYSNDGRIFKAASQVKALLKGNGIDTEPEPAGHVGFFLWGHVPEPFTFYKGICSLPAGHSLWIETNGKIAVQNYCNLKDIFLLAEQSSPHFDKQEMLKNLRAAFLDSLKHHLIADVSVGLFLSSGIDSNTLAALASELSSVKLHSVTLGFKEFAKTVNDETPLAISAAKQYNMQHNTVWTSREDFRSNSAHLLEVMDQPSVDGINSYFISKAAANAGMKVAISGVGGDELFGSYPSFTQIPRMAKAFKAFQRLPLLGRGFRLVSASVLKQFTSPKYAGLLEYGHSYGGAYLLRRGMFMPWELPEILDVELVKEGWKQLQTLPLLGKTYEGLQSDYLKIAALEMNWYMRNQLLRDSDWAGMAHSLEIRTPLVDIDLLKKVAPLLVHSNRPTKADIGRLPLEAIPEEIVVRQKTGFSVPIRHWLMDNKYLTSQRGLRGWTKEIYKGTTRQHESPFNHSSPGRSDKSPPPADAAAGTRQSPGLRILALVPDAFGGHGGIALYNRDLLKALCSYQGCHEVVVVPRLMRFSPEPLPAKLTHITSGLNSKLKFIGTVIRTIMKNSKFDLIICGHINLLPIAYAVKLITGSSLLLEIYGIDVWQPRKNLFSTLFLSKADGIISISEYTKDKFLAWSPQSSDKIHLLPNAIDAPRYGPGPKNADLLRQYGLQSKTVIMTLGRLVSQERYKGFDEIIELLPELAYDLPDIRYLIVGDGNDRQRLVNKVKALELEDKVIFAGFVTDAEKADYYRLADAYVMPSQGEGFGFVFLEAMACGVPVVASLLDGSREAVREGKLGKLTDPRDRESIKTAIREALKQAPGIPNGLEYFSFENFQQRLHRIVDNTIGHERELLK